MPTAAPLPRPDTRAPAPHRRPGGAVPATVLALATVMAMVPAPGTAQELRSGKSKFALLDGRLAGQYNDSVRLTPKFKDSGPLPAYAGRYRGEYLAVAKTAARKHGVPEDLFLRLVQQESGWNIAAVSPKGATGLAQLMPETAARLGVDPVDPRQNLEGGARYLRQMYDRFGTWRLALAAYNAGPEAVEQHAGIPPFAETQNYVKVILGS